MTTTSIAAIYDAIKHCNGEYCYICFSPSSERKLVNPVYILQLKFAIKYSRTDALNKKPFKVCYICEAMAARTVRFQRVVTLAASVEAMLSWMTDDLRDALVQQQFQSISHTNQGISRVIRRGKELDEALKNIVIPQLNCSHVLHVGSDTPAAASANAVGGTSSGGTSPGGTGPVDTAPGGTAPGGMGSGDTGPGGTGPGGTSVCESEPILVEDDPPPPGLVQPSTIPGQLQLEVREKTTGNVVLHPIIMGTNNKMYVPSLKVEIVNNEFLKSVTDKVLFTYANIPIPPPPPPPPPLEPVPRKAVDVQQINSTTMISTYYDFIQKQREEKVWKNPSNLNEDVDEILNKKPKLEDSKTDEVSNGVKDGGWKVMKPAKTYAMKKPVLQMHKVLDWEDKIPMDVISFMDATDPNPIERIMQPNQRTSISPKSPTMGIISDIRTINDNENNQVIVNNDNEDVDNDVLLVENIECIDLC